MKSFKSLGAFAAHLMVLDVKVKAAQTNALEHVAQVIEKTAKGELGTYQPEVGPFQDWVELAESTKEQRVRQGYSKDDPGLRSGKMRDSIQHHTSGSSAVVGSNDENLVFFEFGTEKQPPRPVLGPAVVHNEKAIKRILGQATVKGLIGGDVVHPSLGYDKKID
jgi:HK97 gp10 family phage protein